MRPRSRATRFGIAACAAVLAVAAAACGGDDDPTTTDGRSTATTGAPEATSTTGNTTPGSSPITEASVDAGATAGGELTYLYFGVQLPTFDPALSAGTSTAPGSYLAAVYGMLVYNDYTTDSVVPWMAESLTATDPSTWVLKLRPGVTFSDGTPYDAAAVKYNWERIDGPGQEENPLRRVTAQIASLEVVDDLTLEIGLAAPNVAFDRTVADNLGFIGSPTALQADETAFLQTAPVGAGPFVLRSFDASGSAEFVRNDSYWDQPRPYLDSLKIRFIADDDQRLNAFLNGEGQLMDAGPDHDASSAPDAQVLTIYTPGGGGTFLFNVQRPPFNDKDARLAIQHAIDRQFIVDTLSPGRGMALDGIFQPSSLFNNPDATFPAYDHDEAQRLFNEYAERTGGPMKIQFTAAQQGAGAAEFFQAQFADYDNVNVELNLVDAAVYPQTLAEGGFDLAQFNWNAGYPSPNLRDFYGTGGQRNFGQYSNEEVDELLKSAEATLDVEEQAEFYRQVQDIIVTQDAVAYYIFQLPNVAFSTEELHGLTYAVNGVWLFDRVWLDS